MPECKGHKCEIYWNCSGGCGCGREPLCGAKLRFVVNRKPNDSSIQTGIEKLKQNTEALNKEKEQ